MTPVRAAALLLAAMRLATAPLAAQERSPLRDTIPEVSITGGDAHPNAIRTVPIAFYQPATGVGVGVAALAIQPRADGVTRPNDQTVVVSATTLGQYRFFMQGDWWTRRNRFTISPELEFTFQSLPFYGIGPGAEEVNEERYRARILRAGVFGLVQLRPALYAGLSIGYRSSVLTSFAPGGLIAADTMAGSRSSTIGQVEAMLTYDTRDNVFSARTGTYVIARAGGAPDFLASTRGFSRVYLDARQFIPVSRRDVLALQFVGHVTTGQVPFEILPQFDTEMIGRAYEAGRFRDKALLAVTAEWRHTFTRRIGLALIAQAAKVGPSLRKLDPFSNLEPSVGLGLRYALVPRERAVARIDFAYGRGETALLIGFAEAF